MITWPKDFKRSPTGKSSYRTDTKTFRITTSIHLTFDEDFNNRRNALISYDKHLEAGAYGVSPDEQRTLKLVRELYRPSDRDLYVETFDASSEGNH